MSFFNTIPQIPEDPILSLPIAFAADPRAQKVNLGIGAYQTDEGHPLVLKSVQKAEQYILRQHLDKEYLPIEGDPTFIRCALSLLFGEHSSVLQAKSLFAAQSVGGSSALRVLAEFFAKFVSKNIFISHPSWSNHKQIFERAGLTINSYPYFDQKTKALDHEGMCVAIQNMPPGSLILLHGCCHNPTGMDPTFEQWQILSALIKKQRIIPLFDLAYQGFGRGIEEDAQAVRYFAEEGHEMGIAYSFSKNFGLYAERVGFLTLICDQAALVPNISCQTKYLIRSNYSNPPIHGARIVSTILQFPELTVEWKTELNQMRQHIQEMRRALVEALLAASPKHDFSYLQQQVGLFSFSGLSPEQVQRLRQEKAIYMLSNGRINIAGLNTRNLPYVVEAILSVL